MAAPCKMKKVTPCILFFKQLLKSNQICNSSRIIFMSSSSTATSNTQMESKDPFPLYSSPQVQSVLRRLTGFDMMKIAGPRKSPLERPIYKLLTDEQLSQEQEAARQRLSQRLEMPPPYMKARTPIKEPLAVDTDLAHFDSSKYVFSDVSFGVKDRKRSVVVREVDGSLWEASWDTKERMNQLYNPRPGRSIIKPKLFEEANLERLIAENKFVYILERACAQFEPDDPDFLRISHRVFSAINTSQQFDILRSTRFFAPMTFHLLWTKTIDSLLINMLSKELVADAVDLVKLYCMVHPDGSCAQRLNSEELKESQSVLKAYLETETMSKSELELILQTVMDRSGLETPNALSS